MLTDRQALSIPHAFTLCTSCIESVKCSETQECMHGKGFTAKEINADRSLYLKRLCVKWNIMIGNAVFFLDSKAPLIVRPTLDKVIDFEIKFVNYNTNELWPFYLQGRILLDFESIWYFLHPSSIRCFVHSYTYIFNNRNTQKYFWDLPYCYFLFTVPWIVSWTWRTSLRFIHRI
jgi:hypothetical protein